MWNLWPSVIKLLLLFLMSCHADSERASCCLQEHFSIWGLTRWQWSCVARQHRDAVMLALSLLLPAGDHRMGSVPVTHGNCFMHQAILPVQACEQESHVWRKMRADGWRLFRAHRAAVWRHLCFQSGDVCSQWRLLNCRTQREVKSKSEPSTNVFTFERLTSCSSVSQQESGSVCTWTRLTQTKLPVLINYESSIYRFVHKLSVTVKFAE